MKNCLLLLGVVAALAFGSPAYSQYIYLDTNGDQVCDASDVLVPGANTVDVYLQTDTNADFSPAVCQNGTQTLSIFSYELVLHASGSGSVSYGTWSHNSDGLNLGLPGFGQLRAPASGGGDFSVFWGKSTGAEPAGFYRLGRVIATVTGNPTISIATSTPLGAFGTSFGSECPGSLGLNTIYLGGDFTDVCGTSSTTPVTTQTTWAKIKEMYK
jgi:hypothetical protein